MKKQPFSVPEGYFDDFADRMRPWETCPQPHVRPSAQRIVLAVCASAAMIGFLAVVLFTSDLADGQYGTDDIYMELLYSDLIPVTDPDCIFAYEDELAESYGSVTDGQNEALQPGVPVKDVAQVPVQDSVE